jgi:RHS repeat-associated protein
LTTVDYLYDGEGKRVALKSVDNGTTTTMAYLEDIEEVQISGSTTTTTAYYYAGSQRIAEAVNGTISYLGNDLLGSPTVALNDSGALVAAQLYDPYGQSRYSSGTMPTDLGFTGQHSDGVTGLDYYVSRYYDPTVGQFISPDSALPENGYNPWGLSRYAYVQGNPETITDPDGHCWPLCTMAIGAVIGAAVGAATSVATQAVSGKPINWGDVAKEAVVGAASGAVSGLAGPQAGILVHTAVGAAEGAVGQVVSNALNHKPLGDGVLLAAAIGGVTGEVTAGAGKLLKKFGGKAAKGSRGGQGRLWQLLPGRYPGHHTGWGAGNQHVAGG